MTIPRNDVLAAEPSTKKTVDSDRFHKVFLLDSKKRPRVIGEGNEESFLKE